jgi:hypothetical protein
MEDTVCRTDEELFERYTNEQLWEKHRETRLRRDEKLAARDQARAEDQDRQANKFCEQGHHHKSWCTRQLKELRRRGDLQAAALLDAMGPIIEAAAAPR